MLDKKKEAVIPNNEEPSKTKIEIRDVSRVFRIRSNKTKKAENFLAVNDLNLAVKEGEFLTIVGPSGCGKSTILDMLAGLESPTGGAMYMDGKRITGPALDRGIVLQGYALFPWRTVRRNVEFGLEIKGIPKKERSNISERFIDLVGLNGFAERYPYELSGGMKQRVAIARALAYDPEVLLMDEPFAAVDAQTREVLQEELLRIWEETHKTIIFVTHSIEEAIFLADRVAVMATSPGTVKEVIDVKIPRSGGRDRSSTEFGWVRHKIYELLQNGQSNREKSPAGSQDVAEAISLSADL